MLHCKTILMAKNKTHETDSSVTDFINAVEESTKRDDSFRITALFQNITGFEPKMWGPSIIGFGSYHYVYDSGHEGDAPIVGFSPRKDAISIYLPVFEERNALLEKLGKHKTGKACIYIKKLDQIDIAVLGQLIAASVKHAKQNYD